MPYYKQKYNLYYISACVVEDDVAEAAFRWSLTLVSKILVRTVLEGPWFRV